jgi:hypothetical protein
MMWRNIPILVFVAVLASAFLLTEANAKKIAFVVGNQYYLPELLSTNSSHKDADDFAAELKKRKFKIYKDSALHDLTKSAFDTHWELFLELVEPGDEVIIYYAGHGTERGGVNYLVPKLTNKDEFERSKTDPTKPFISVRDLVQRLNAEKPSISLWFLDACRSLDGTVSGLKSIPESGSAFFFYASEGEQKSISPKGQKNSLFTSALLYTMKMYPTIPVHITAKVVQRNVRNRIIKENLKSPLDGPYAQNPAFYDALPSPWCFLECVSGQILEMNHFDGRRVISETDAVSFRKSLSGVAAASNAVFVGRETTASSDCASGVSIRTDRHPFGCGALLRFSKNDATLVGSELTAKTPVNIRKGLTLPNSSGVQRQTCIAKTLDAGSNIKITGIFEMVYASEIFYWATVNTSDGCLQKN